ncbi:MAG: tetratricopeptide repeat protein [Planctomycetota bacterium]
MRRAGARLTTRRAAPRLGGFRTGNARFGNARFGNARVGAAGFGRLGRVGQFFGTGYRWGGFGFANGCAPIWNGYWGFNNWVRFGGGFGGIGGFGGGFGCNPFQSSFALGFGSFGLGFGCNAFAPLWGAWGGLTPWNAWRTNFWNRCYSATYWNNWSVPNALPSNFWWYPNDTYCPTYLSVPSSVIVVDEETAADGFTLAADEAPRSTVIGGIVDGARAAAAPAPVEKSPAPTSLATKYVELGDYYFQAARFEEAAEAYAKARYHAPNDASVHFVLADAAFANGDYHYASFLISEAVRLDPTIVTADVDKRRMYGDRTLFEAHMTALEKHCKDKPYDAWAELVLAYNLRFSEQPMRALAAFRRVLQLDRNNQAAAAFAADLEAADPGAGSAGSDEGPSIEIPSEKDAATGR